MDIIRDLMIQLKGADPELVNRIAWEKGSLPVRLAMLGLASIEKDESPLWWGYPPGVFIGYKWNGLLMQNFVIELAEHIRGLGYQVFLDLENLDENADAYFQIPKFITSLQECSFYILLLTESCADMITARKGKTTWIFDEYQHAVRIVNSGRLFMVPILLEPKGTTDYFTLENVINLTNDSHDFEKLHNVLVPDPLRLNKIEVKELTATIEEFDLLFLTEHWDESGNLLRNSKHLAHTFDHQFRCMLHAMYTADQTNFEAVFTRLNADYGSQFVYHLYSGYCSKHRIPNRMTI